MKYDQLENKTNLREYYMKSEKVQNETFEIK